MGSTEDPEDGKAVAATVFGAVFVYAVSLLSNPKTCWTTVAKCLPRDFWYSAGHKRGCIFGKAGKERLHFREDLEGRWT
jgi:hypothetical protein